MTTNSTPLMIDGPTGNIGIGTTTPSQKIEVAGAINTVDSSGDVRPYGKGRIGTKRYGTSDEESGLCSNGSINFGLSLNSAG